MLTANEKITPLISSIRSHPEATFYADLWGDNNSFENLSAVTREHFIYTPLPRRRYKNARSLVKLVHDGDRSFLSEWAFEDIAREPWGMPSKRPLVYLSNPHEVIEKSMWCYEHNMLPLAGEKDPDLTMYTAEKYMVDSIIGDASSLMKVVPLLQKIKYQLGSISLIGQSFDPSVVRRLGLFAKHLRTVLAIPETGAIAEAPLIDGRVIFRALKDSFLECRDTLIVTKMEPLVTPIVRYDTGIKVQEFNESGFALL